MTDRTMKMHMSQAFMQEAIRHYLQTVVIAPPVEVKAVEVDGPDRKLNQVDHFNVTLTFPESEKP